MKKKGTRTQLRACTKCGKVGHNKSTCPEIATRIKKVEKKNEIQNTAYQPVKFFIHHTHFAPHESPHFTDLKNKDTDPWQKVTATSPDKVD